jgi:hypothetical protein
MILQITSIALFPAEPVAILPDSSLPDSVCCDVLSFPVLFSIPPLAAVIATVWPVEDTNPILLIEAVFSNVHSAILPNELSFPVHLVSVPLAFVHFVGVCQLTFPLAKTMDKLALINPVS